METIRKTANNRSEFARVKYEQLIKSLTITNNGTLIDQISGFKARKIAQALRVYAHYVFVFNGSKQRGTAAYAVKEKAMALRKKTDKGFKTALNVKINLEKESIFELQLLDCNCNNCGFFVRDIEKTQALNSNEKIIANKIHYGKCDKLNIPIAEIANIALLETQGCFVHRKAASLNNI